MTVTSDLLDVRNRTLPDLLRGGLDVVFVGINPSSYSVQRGHYFARPTNRFWPCFSRSVLSAAARKALSIERLGPQHDRVLLDFGIGFTDVAKRATAKADELAQSELDEGVPFLLRKIEQDRPRVLCFHGVTGYRRFHLVLAGKSGKIKLGLQRLCVGPTRIYLVPNPSGANAHFTPDDQIRWYDQLARYLCKLPTAMSAALITVADLYDLMQADVTPIIIDVRSSTARALEPRSLPGSIHVPLEQVGHHVEHLPRDHEIVLYSACPNGARVNRVAKILTDHGFKKVRPLFGGLDAWIAAGYAVVSAPGK